MPAARGRKWTRALSGRPEEGQDVAPRTLVLPFVQEASIAILPPLHPETIIERKPGGRKECLRDRAFFPKRCGIPSKRNCLNNQIRVFFKQIDS